MRGTLSAPSAASEPAATAHAPPSTANTAATARSVTSRTGACRRIQVARPLCAIHARAAIAIQLCRGITAQTALCSAARRPHRPIDVRPAAIAIFLPAAALVAIDASITAGVDVASTVRPIPVLPCGPRRVSASPPRLPCVTRPVAPVAFRVTRDVCAH